MALNTTRNNTHHLRAQKEPMRLRKSHGPGPKMNREQRRAFERYLRTPEGKAAVAKVKAEHVAKAQRESSPPSPPVARCRATLWDCGVEWPCTKDAGHEHDHVTDARGGGVAWRDGVVGSVAPHASER